MINKELDHTMNTAHDFCKGWLQEKTLGKGNIFWWTSDENGDIIIRRKDISAKSEIVTGEQIAKIISYVGREWVKLANNVEKLYNGMEVDGIGHFMYNNIYPEPTFAQLSSHLSAIFYYAGVWEWNGKRSGLQFRGIDNVDWRFLLTEYAQLRNSHYKENDQLDIRTSEYTLAPVDSKIASENANNALAFFKSLKPENKFFLGNNSYVWSRHVMGEMYEVPEVLNQRFYRDELFQYCSNNKNSDFNTLLAILSWGGMKVHHGRTLLRDSTTILDIVKKLREKHFADRKEVFKYIQDRRKASLLPGLGIGYYTKLICFLHPELNGYIMDQWVAKSVNILLGKNLVDIANSSNWVTDKNDHNIYEAFCSYIDELAQDVGTTGFKLEERLFSYGGRTKGKWRAFVVENTTH